MFVLSREEFKHAYGRMDDVFVCIESAQDVLCMVLGVGVWYDDATSTDRQNQVVYK